MDDTTQDLIAAMEMEQTIDYRPGSFWVGADDDKPLACNECKIATHPDNMHEGICIDCGKRPARCVACGFETLRRELNADLLCSDHHEAA